MPADINYSIGNYDVNCIEGMVEVTLTNIYTDKDTRLEVTLTNPDGQNINFATFLPKTSNAAFIFSPAFYVNPNDRYKKYLLQYRAFIGNNLSEPTDILFTPPFCVAIQKNTGQKGWYYLEQYDTNTGQATGITKQNRLGDPDYVPPVDDLNMCPINE